MSTSSNRRARPPAGDTAPLSVSRPELLEGGSDARFRRLVYDLLTVSARMQELRNLLARRMGVTGPQYSIITAVAHLQAAEGASVRAVADQLHVSGAFITAEGGKLVRRGLLAKRPNPRDGRGVLLELTALGRERLDAVAPDIRAVNDRFFGSLTRNDFDHLGRIAEQTVVASLQALSAVPVNDGPARGPAVPRSADDETVRGQV